MKAKKTRIIGLAATVICASLALPSQASADTHYWDGIYPCVRTDMPVTIHADGRYIQTDVPPTINNGRTLVPLRSAGEAVGASIDWNQQTQTATATKDGKTVEFTIGSNTYYIDGQPSSMDVAPTITGGRTMLPLRVLGESLQANVTWDANLYDVKIDTEEPDYTPDLPNGIVPEFKQMLEKYYVESHPGDTYGTFVRYAADDNGFGEPMLVQQAVIVSESDAGLLNVVRINVGIPTDRTNPDIAVYTGESSINATPSGNTYVDMKYTSASFYQGPNSGSFGTTTEFYKIKGDLLTHYQSNIQPGSMVINPYTEFSRI